MMITINSYYLFVLLAANVLLLVVASTSLIKFERRCKRIEEFWDSPVGTALADDNAYDEMYEQVMATKRLEQRLGELQRAVKLIDIRAPKQSRPPPVAQQVPVVPQLPIDNAVRMAKHGASVEDLTRNCGLNIGEARLMQKLHGRARTAANGH